MLLLGSKVKTLRESANLSLRELASKLGVSSYSHLAEIEAGKSRPSVDLLLKMADYFGVTTDQLLRDELELGEITEDSRD